MSTTLILYFPPIIHIDRASLGFNGFWKHLEVPKDACPERFLLDEDVR